MRLRKKQNTTSKLASAIAAQLIVTSISTSRVVRGFVNYVVISMRGAVQMSQWKSVEANKPSGFLDKNGVEICLGDIVTYRRKVRAEHRYNRKTGTYDVTPGHYEMVTAKVVGFGEIVKLHWRGYPVQLEYIHLKETGRFNVFRVYLSEKLEIMLKSEK